jgi:DNA-binding SARP family transcriptional activator/DNA-binding response OmpR family regulator
MSLLKLSLLGTPQISHDEKILTLPTKKALALLVYLALEKGWHTRDKICTLLWPDSDNFHARGTLRRGLTQIRQALQQVATTQNNAYLLTKQDLIALNFECEVAVDTLILQNAFEIARTLNPLTASPETLEILQTTVNLYRGDFLEGFGLEDAPDFDDWASVQRETYHRRLSLVLDRLALLYGESGNLPHAIETARQWVKHDPISEPPVALLIDLYLRDNNRVSALNTYEDYCAILEKELGIEPTETLQKIINNAKIIKSAKKTAPPVKEAKSGHILIVDDDPDISDLLSTTLQRLGYNVTATLQPQQAIDLLEKLKIDLIITDAMMPGVSGYDLVNTVRSYNRWKNLPIIMLTSLNTSDDALQAFQVGVDDFVTKPWNTLTLSSKINNLLGRGEWTEGFRQGSILEGESSGLRSLDEKLGGNWLNGTNILVLGNWGSGKSNFGLHFLAQAVLKDKPALLISLDDAPERTFQRLNRLSAGKLETNTAKALFRQVSNISEDIQPPLEINNTDLTRLVTSIIEAGNEIGQNPKQKAGGRRLIDSISSLLLQYDLALVQRFVMQLARTSKSYGDVSTLFILETETVTEPILVHLRYFMDGVLELRHVDNRYEMRIIHLKWQTYPVDWFVVDYFD